MSNITMETDKPAAATRTPEPESKPKPAQAAKAAKRGTARKTVKRAAKKSAKPRLSGHKPAGERSNKKAAVLALMRRPKGATLAEIMSATAWQKHTVRGFVSILGKKGEAAIESSKNAAGQRVYKIPK